MSNKKQNTSVMEAPEKNKAEKEPTGKIEFIIEEVESEPVNSAISETQEKPTLTKAQKSGRIAVLCFLGVVLISVATGILFCLANQNKSDYIPQIISNVFKSDFAFPDYISVNGVSLAGLTEEEALQEVGETEKNLLRKFSYKITAADKTAFVNEESFSYIFNTSDVIEQAKKYVEGNPEITEPKDFPIEYVIDSEKINGTLDTAAANLDSNPVNPTVTAVLSDRLKFSESKNGYTANRQMLYDAFADFYASDRDYGEVSLIVDTSYPRYSASDLSAKIRLISKYTTVSTNNANGNTNMRLALNACNGSVIMPDEVWSFNAKTGNSNLQSNGYLPATVIVGGELQSGIGGGICQASTTIYDAALFAGLTVVERHCHYWVSKYANPGFDSTIDYPRLDLKLKNNTNYPVYIYCEMTGKSLVARIFGVQPTSYDKLTMTESLAKEAGEFFYVNSYRNFFKNGVLVKSEYLGSSKYSGTYKGDVFTMYNEATDTPPPKPTTPQTPEPEPEPEPEVSQGEQSQTGDDSSQSNTSSEESQSGETSSNESPSSETGGNETP